MKLSEYAKQAGVSYRTAWRWWKQGTLSGIQRPSGTIIITESLEFKDIHITNKKIDKDENN